MSSQSGSENTDPEIKRPFLFQVNMP